MRRMSEELAGRNAKMHHPESTIGIHMSFGVDMPI